MDTARPLAGASLTPASGPRAPRPLDLRQHAGGVNRLSLAEQAYAVLKQAIIDITLPPGTPVTEAQLAVSLGMSKSPIRAALVNLQRDGLVAISPYRGTLVSEMRLRDIQNLFDVRLLLEPYVVGRVTPALDEDDFRAVEGILTDAETAVDTRDYSAFLAANARFHGYFITRLGNTFVLDAFASMAPQLQRARHLTVTAQLEQTDLLAEHRQIFAAMRRREAEVAAAHMHSHISRFMETFAQSAKQGGEWLDAEESR